ncbi:retrovirus-related pol polyprotein from transposon TNT 1-94 [Tanacetum coccineum]|uniref:Retrovirus-related pol polyprotein from transposon TNT 1-94 n=1 Tax=Tanacetum coccineum TaxID=301880 RepID=A0ABQ4XGK4_9ASTR
MAKASPTQAWLWHRRLSRLNFDYINLLSKKDVVIGLPKLSISNDNYVPLVKYTWTLFLRSKDETPEVLKEFLTMIQRNLQALVISVRTDRGTEFLYKTLNAFFKEEGIENQTSTPRTPEQNDVVKRRNRTLVEAARTMLSASKLPLFFWAEAIATACFTQNRSKSSSQLMRKTINIPSQQELDLLFGPLYNEFFNDGTSRVNKSSSLTDQILIQQDH